MLCIIDCFYKFVDKKIREIILFVFYIKIMVFIWFIIWLMKLLILIMVKVCRGWNIVYLN